MFLARLNGWGNFDIIEAAKCGVFRNRALRNGVFMQAYITPLGLTFYIETYGCVNYLITVRCKKTVHSDNIV